MKTIVAFFELLFGWFFDWPLGWFFGWVFRWRFPRWLTGWIFEWLIHYLDLESFCLRSLERSRITEGGVFYSRLNLLGFYRVQHRTALTVFRKGEFVSLLEAPHGHSWHHIWPRIRRDEIGPEIELSPSFIPCEYEDTPTSLGMSLPEKLRGEGQIISLPGIGRPVGITIKLVISYIFKPQNSSLQDAVEMLIYKTREERSQIVFNLVRPELERLTGQLHPVDIKLRLADKIIIEGLEKALLEKLRPLGYEVLGVEIDNVALPTTIETAFIANQELLRQSIRGYSPDDLTRMIATQIGYGLRTGSELVTSADLAPLINRITPEGPPPRIIEDQSKKDKKGRWRP